MGDAKGLAGGEASVTRARRPDGGGARGSLAVRARRLGGTGLVDGAAKVPPQRDPRLGRFEAEEIPE